MTARRSRKRQGTPSWLWIGLIAVLVLGITGTYLVMRANEEKAAFIEDVDPDGLIRHITEDAQVTVYFYSPT